MSNGIFGKLEMRQYPVPELRSGTRCHEVPLRRLFLVPKQSLGTRKKTVRKSRSPGLQWLSMAMRIISKRRLREYWAAVPASKPALIDWFTKVRYATWPNFAALRATFNSADAVGNCTVFNVGGNRFRLI